VISLQKLTSSSGAARYHDNALKEEGPAHDRADNYYANEQAPLTWQGKGAEMLGLAGAAVTKEQFVRFLEGEITNPANGEVQDLSGNAKGEARRLGYDFTISAPKSVSIVGIVGGDERVVQAHIDANRAAMGWLEEHGAQVRVKDANGHNQARATGNLLYATVRHETSRENDPQLHSHNVVVAVSYDQDAGKWRSLTNDELFQLRTRADTVYKAELVRHLRGAGYEVAYRDNGRDFDIRGVEGAALAAFSQRSQQMREALLARGIDPDGASHQARQTAVLDTRSRKVEHERDYLHAIWDEKARDAGLDLKRVVEQARQAGPQIVPEEQLARDGVTRAVRHLSEREQAFKVSTLESDAVFFSRGAGIGTIKSAIEDRKEDRSLVDRAGDGAPRLTTSAAIANELTLQDGIRKGKGKGVAVVATHEEFDVLLERFEARKTAQAGVPFRLSVEQVNAARNVLMHEDKFQGIQGDAGTGKTAALEFVQDVARERGWEVRGIATSTTGARELENATGIPSQTVAAFLNERDERIRMLKAELRQIEVDFAHAPSPIPQVKRVAKRDLHLEDDGLAPGRYVFDSKSGEVLKSGTGAWHPLNTLGVKLQDAGQTRRTGAERQLRQAETLGDRFRARMTRASGGVQETLGRSLASYEVVGRTEARAARAAHRERNVQETAQLRAYLATSAQIENLLASGNAEGRRLLLVMDEASMTGAKDSARLSEIARDLGARVVLQGDTKQHGSVSAGRAFLQAQEGGINLSKIETTRRFDQATAQQKKAIAEMKLGRFAAALASLDTTVNNDLYGTAAARFVANRQQLLGEGITDPRIGVVTITNHDRKETNKAVREALRKEGVIQGPDHKKQHLDDPKLTGEQYRFVASLAAERVDRLTALRDYKRLGIARDEMLTVVEYDLNRNRLLLRRENGKMVELDPAKHKRFGFARMEERAYAVGDRIEARANIGRSGDPGRVPNGTRGVITEIDTKGARIRWQDGRDTPMSNRQLRHVDHAYAHTSHKEQGVTTHREIFLVSPEGAHWLNREASYVAASRARHNTEIVTSEEGRAKMLENAGSAPGKTTAIDIGSNLALDQIRNREQIQSRTGEQRQERRGPEFEL
jgi:conjugative relaxase-like TrwC/TraI family protein